MKYIALPKLSDYQFVSSYVSALRDEIGYYLPYLPQSLADDLTEDGFHEILEKDEQISRCKNLLCLKIIAEQIQIKTIDNRLTDFFKKVLLNCEDLMHALLSLSEKSLIFGLGIQRKYYREKKIKGFVGTWTLPFRFQEVDRRRLRIERDLENKNLLRWTIWSPIYDQYIILENRKKCQTQPILGAGLQDYIWYWNKFEEDRPYGWGLGDTLYRTAYLKQKLLELYFRCAHSWSEPYMIAFIEAAKASINADLGADISNASDRVQNLIATMEKTKSTHCLVADKADDIKFQEHGTVGTNLIKDFIEWCEEKQLMLILGSKLATDAADTGSYGQGSFHQQQTNTHVRYHQRRLAQNLKKNLFLDIVYRNRDLFQHNFGFIPNEEDILGVDFSTPENEIKKEGLKDNIAGYRGNIENVVNTV